VGGVLRPDLGPGRRDRPGSASAIANFLFIPYYPVWAILIIILDVFVIWALAVHGREMTEV
jgi:hypothetical protein